MTEETTPGDQASGRRRRRTVSSVALIGPDGSGKTTIAHALVDAFPTEMRYLYMGTTPESTNIALPTTRFLAHRRRRLARRRDPEEQRPPLRANVRPHRPDTRGRVVAGLRLLNWFADAWYRQIASWVYQVRGLVVVYDRHFVFDAAPSEGPPPRPVHRLYYWLLSRLYPRPDLVVLLEAPADVLHARKPEASVDYVERRMAAFRRESSRHRRVITVDVTQTLDRVVEEIASCMSAMGRGT